MRHALADPGSSCSARRPPLLLPHRPGVPNVTSRVQSARASASKQLFSVGDAAAYLGVSPSTMRRRIAAGAVRARRWGRTWMLWRDDLDWYCTRVAATDAGVGGGG